MAIGDFDPNDPLGAAQGIQKRKLPGTASFLPAANQIGSRNTAFATGAPINTISQNQSGQIPVGGYGLGALNQAGYSRSPQMNMSNFMNQPSNQQPTLTGYHWYSGTGGVSGGNNASARYNWSDNTITREPAGSQGAFPKLGLTRADQPAIGNGPSPYIIAPEHIESYTSAGGMGAWDYSVPAAPVFRGQNLPYTMVNGQPTQWGVMPTGGDPSVGAMEVAKRYISAGVPSQPTQGGGIIPGIQAGSKVSEFPGGGMAIMGPPIRKDQSWLGGGY